MNFSDNLYIHFLEASIENESSRYFISRCRSYYGWDQRVDTWETARDTSFLVKMDGVSRL